jgi:hypothetical protein
MRQWGTCHTGQESCMGAAQMKIFVWEPNLLGTFLLRSCCFKAGPRRWLRRLTTVAKIRAQRVSSVVGLATCRSLASAEDIGWLRNCPDKTCIVQEGTKCPRRLVSHCCNISEKRRKAQKFNRPNGLLSGCAKIRQEV